MKLFFIGYLLLLPFTSFLLYQDTPLQQSMQRGKEVYADFCVTCHMENGEGVPMVFPPLAQSDYLINNRTESIRGIKYGQSGELVVNGVTYNSVMMNMGLEDEEVANVMNYILNSWGNTTDRPVSPDEVAAIGPE